MKKLYSALAVILCLALLCACSVQTEATPLSRTAEGIHALLGVKGGLLADEDAVRAGTSISDWTAIALRLAGSDEDYGAYLSALERHVTDCYAKAGTLHEYKATEYHRIALVVLTLGGDPTAFGTKPDGTPVDLIADGIYDYPGDLYAQGLNSPIYALKVLDMGQFDVPDGAKWTREAILSEILSRQEPEGGFGLVVGTPDVDITAMALQALAPYAADHPQVIAAALAWLSGQMSDEGTFSSYGAVSSESISQTLLALAALGIDAGTDARFVRGETTLLTALERFRQPDGSFAHALGDTEGNLLATTQAAQALAALAD